MMSFKQRINLKFLFRFRKTPTETFNFLQKVYADVMMSRNRIFKWLKRFKMEERMWKMTLGAEGQQQAERTKVLSV